MAVDPSNEKKLIKLGNSLISETLAKRRAKWRKWTKKGKKGKSKTQPTQEVEHVELSSYFPFPAAVIVQPSYQALSVKDTTVGSGKYDGLVPMAPIVDGYNMNAI